MNTASQATRVLCFGDSNTWGQNEDKTARQAPDVRWTGLLQQMLGANFETIEEGLGSRTTDLDYRKKPGCNGRQYLVPCLTTHTPFDYVVLMLGTNDLKTEYRRTAAHVAEALVKLIADVKDYAVNPAGKAPQTLLVSPILLDDQAPRWHEFYNGLYDSNSAATSRELAGEVKKVAENGQCRFLDAAQVAHAGIDGVHLATESHRPLAEAIRNIIRGEAA